MIVSVQMNWSNSEGNRLEINKTWSIDTNSPKVNDLMGTVKMEEQT